QFISCKNESIISSGQDWIKVDQGSQWTDAVRNAYYTEDQGVRSIPYSWLSSLNDPTGVSFLHDNLQRYGFLPIKGRQLPVGFALGRDTANIMSVGLTCAACHTRQIRVGEELYRIDGGPAFVNNEKYVKDLESALIGTINNQVQLEHFLDRVITASISNGDPAINDRNALRNKVIRFQQNLSLFNQLSLPNADMWGVGRTDALNQIFNRVAGIDISPYPDSMIISNIAIADKPVRFPFIWNMQYQDYTQWGATSVNGNSNQALLRNTAECLGVGAQFRPVPNSSMPDGFDYLAVNSMNISGLLALEGYINKMGAPKWPWSVNNNLVAQGADIFTANCASCHGKTPGEPRPPSTTTWATPAINVGTDSWYFNSLTRSASPGVLSSLFPAVGPLGIISKTVTQKILQQYQPSITFIASTNSVGVGKYESRVMEGIWAVAPYLHNGSVPTLEDLLKPASQRPSTFFVGVNYDTLKIGLSVNQPLQAGYQFNTSTLGNSNVGHEYGTQLNAQDRAALIEYLKTL
ncbi:MAG: cytochrome c, partial [Bacteroidota bacterium]